MNPPRPAYEYVCTACDAPIKNWQEMEEYQHTDCGGLVRFRAEIERDKYKADRDIAVGEVARIQASPTFSQDQRCQIIEMCHDLVNRALLNEKYCAENDLPNYSTSHRLQNDALRALLTERDRLADRVWQLEKAVQLARGGK